MDDLAGLLSALNDAQQAKAAVKLSERNVVELIIKLKQLGILGDDLLHTINGKEYITTDRLKADVQAALRQAGGRLELTELPALVGVDLLHCEKQAAAIVAESGGSVFEAHGELITLQYFDSLAAEVNELLQGSGVLRLSDLALSYTLNTELLLTNLSARVGPPPTGIINAHLEGGLLYTPAYVRNIKAQLRGALRGVSTPVSIPALVRELGLEHVGGGGGGGMVSGLIEELVSEGAVAGSLKGGASMWQPAVYVAAQAAAVSGFYAQNGWIGYDTVKKAGVANEKAYLRGAMPDGIPLETVYASPSLLAQLESAVDEAMLAGGWLDCAPLLPSALTSADVQMLLAKCALLGAKETGKAADAAQKPEVLAGTCVVSAVCLADLRDRLEADARIAAHQAITERKAAPAASVSGASATSNAGSGAAGKKKGPKEEAAEDSDDDWSMGNKKGKKGKGGGAAKSKAAKGAKAGGQKGPGGGPSGAKQKGGGADAVGVPDGEELAGRVVELQPDMEGAGDEGALPEAVAQLLRPAAVAAYQAALAAAFTASAEERRRTKDAGARVLDDAFCRLQLYGRGAESLQEDDATCSTLQRHALRTAGAEALDALLRWAKLEFLDPELTELERTPASVSGAGAVDVMAGALAPGERLKIAKGLPEDLAQAATKAIEALNGADTKDLESALEDAANECGLRLRRLDKKSEKAALAAQRTRLMALLSGEDTPANALALALPLLFLKATGRLVSVPGRAIGGVLARLKAELPEDSYTAMAAFHEGVVEALKQGDDSDGQLQEKLAAQLPGIKALVGLGSGADE